MVGMRLYTYLEPFEILYLGNVIEIPLLDPANIHIEKEVPTPKQDPLHIHTCKKHLVSYLYLPLIATTSVGLAQENEVNKFTSQEDCRSCCDDNSVCLSAIYV